MASYTIVTTDEQERALTSAYEQAGVPPIVPGSDPGDAEPPPTQAEYLQELVNLQVLNPLVAQFNADHATDLLELVGTIPLENQADALAAIETVVVEHGGTAPFRGAPYLWSTNTAAPPRDQSIEANATQANMPTVSKLFLDHLDADGLDRMTALLGIAAGATLRMFDPAVPATLLIVRVTVAPIQRQGADGHVEIGVAFLSFTGAFVDAQPVQLEIED